MSEPQLAGQTVVVIGGSAGIGLETARSARAEGADVILTGRNPDRLEARGARGRRGRAPRRSTPTTSTGSSASSTTCPPIDHVMVSGGGPYYAPLAEIDFAEVRADVERHLLLPMQRRPPRHRQGAAGRLAGLHQRHRRPAARRSGLTLIGALTAATPALTENLALEIAPIRVNLIAPGFVDTPLSASLLGDGLEARREELRDRLPIRRVVGPEDVATLAVHLMTQHRAHRRDLRHRRRPAARPWQRKDPDALRHRSRRHVPRLRAARSHGHAHARLSEIQGDDPLILTLARGHYCPKEHQQHLELAAFYPKIAVAYTQIATISTDEHHTLAGVPRVGRRPVAVPRGPGADRPAGPGHPGVHRPRQRPDDPAHARAQARAGGPQRSTTATGSGAARRSPTSGTTSATCRPRSARTGISSVPGLREAWDAGDRSSFHGWDKRGVAGSGGP